jgi:hypothetical protein
MFEVGWARTKKRSERSAADHGGEMTVPRVSVRITKVVLVATAVGLLAFCSTARVAGAAPAKNPSAYGLGAFEKHFNCANATRRLTHAEQVELGPAAKVTRMVASEAKATQAGQSRRAAALAKRIAAEQMRIARMSPRARKLLNKYVGFIEAKCHVVAPPYVPRSSSAPKASARTNPTSTTASTSTTTSTTTTASTSTMTSTSGTASPS